MRYAVEVIGWTGAILMVLAYALLSAGKLESRSVSYQVMNILGAAGFIVNSGWNGAFPSASVNVVWMAIGIFALVRGRKEARAAVARSA
jgi:hypothetical protein